MNILRIHGHHHHHPHPSLSHFAQTTLQPTLHYPSSISITSKFPVSSALQLSFSKPSSLEFRHVRASEIGVLATTTQKEEEEEDNLDLTQEGEVYQKTQRLVECSMFAALGGLAYILSSSLAIENYFGCFFALPIVFSSLRWDAIAGRKTMVATAILLLVLTGPIKALVYLLQHGLLGLTMGSLWRVRANWRLSIGVSAIVRALGAVAYVLVYSFLIRENILALITINIHASLTFILTSFGYSTIPSMNVIYAIFGSLVLLNCSFFVFLLHLLYALFFTRLGMKASLNLPRWLHKAI